MKKLADPESEKVVLGYVMNNPESLPVVQAIIRRSEYFSIPAHRTIYVSLMDMEANKEIVDLSSTALGTYLSRLKKLQGVGGYAYLGELEDNAPPQCNVSYYAHILAENYAGNKACEYATGLVSKILSEDERATPLYSVNSTLSEVIQKLQTLQAMVGAKKNKVKTVPEIMSEVWKDLEQIEKGGENPAMSTGFENLDSFMGGGLYPSEMNIVAARPSVGKTSLVVNIANNCSPDKKILLFSLETTSKSITRDRLLPLNSKVTSTSLRAGGLSDDDWGKLAEAGDKLGRYKNFKMCDQALMTIEDIEVIVAAECGADQGGVDLIIIDYIQLINTVGRFGNREQEVSHISKRLSALIKEYGLCSVVLAQLNRESEKHKRRPILSDMRESGGLEQDADTIIALSQEKTEQGESAAPIIAEFLKNRNGARGIAQFDFNKKFTRFESISLDL